MVAFIDAASRRVRGRVDLRVLPIAPSTYFRHRARADRSDAPVARGAQRDDELRVEIQPRLGRASSGLRRRARCGGSSGAKASRRPLHGASG